jgi:lipoprotein-anchoring transpeptidase ErfK/SrfK
MRAGIPELFLALALGLVAAPAWSQSDGSGTPTISPPTEPGAFRPQTKRQTAGTTGSRMTAPQLTTDESYVVQLPEARGSKAARSGTVQKQNVVTSSPSRSDLLKNWQNADLTTLPSTGDSSVAQGNRLPALSETRTQQTTATPTRDNVTGANRDQHWGTANRRTTSSALGDSAPYRDASVGRKPAADVTRSDAPALDLSATGEAADGESSQQLPESLRRQVVRYSTPEPPGTIIVDTRETYLYFVLGNGKAVRYGIGVGRQGFTWSGSERITAMKEWPDWSPPREMLDRQPYLPRVMAGGQGNPLGSRALYLGNTLYRIHGTNEPGTIGKTVSSGCIRLLNEDIENLYNRVRTGTRVVVLPQEIPSDQLRDMARTE